MPRHRHSPATARGGRRFGLPASAPVQARRRSLPRPAPVFASVRRHPRPGERSSCRSGGSQPLLATLTTLSVCLGSAINESGGNVATEGFCNTPSASTAPARSAPVRITPRSCQASVTAGEAATAPEASGTVAAGERSKRCFSVERPLAGLVKKKNGERRRSPSIATITASPSDNRRYVRVVRCASTARFAARPSG